MGASTEEGPGDFEFADEEAQPGETAERAAETGDEEHGEPESAEAAEGLFETGADDEDEDEKPADSKPVPWDRFQKENRTKRRYREERDAERQARSAIERELEDLRSQYQPMIELYGDREDPLSVLREDKRFMDALETVKRDPRAAQAIQLVYDTMRNGGHQPMPESAAPVRQAAKQLQQQPKSGTGDPRVDVLLKQQLEARTREMLKSSAVRPDVHRAVIRDVLATADTAKHLSEDDLKLLVRESFRQNGWSREFLTAAAKDAPRKPPTGGGRSRAAASSAPRSDADESSRKEGPKTYQELQQRTRSRMRSLLDAQMSRGA
jgi:hypothetical protein